MTSSLVRRAVAMTALVAVSTLLVSAGVPGAASAARSTAGKLDASFGSGGKTVTPEKMVPVATAVQPDGRLVVGGCAMAATRYVACSQFEGTSVVVARYTTNGELDPTFGTDGFARTQLGDKDVVADMVLAPDGGIIVGGYVRGCDVTLTCSISLGLARFLPNGQLDTSFGQGGKVVTNPILMNYVDLRAHSLAVQPDGKIIAAGGICDTRPYAGGCERAMAVLRYTASGSLDTSFGVNGLSLVRFPDKLRDVANDVVIDDGGNIIVAGYTTRAVCAGCNYNLDFAFAKLTPDGSRDTAFGQDGTGTLAVHADAGDILSTVALSTVDGTPAIVAAGRSGPYGNSTSSAALIRLSLSGALDPAFGAAGLVLSDIGPEVTELAADGTTGRLVVALGRCCNQDFAVARFLGDGTQDRRFGRWGLVTTDFGGRDYAASVAIQPQDGKIVLVGTTVAPDDTPSLALARYLP